MCHKVSPAPFSLNEHHGNFAVRSGNRTLSVRESNLHCIHRNAPSYERYRCNIIHQGSIDGLGTHSALVCTHRELWSATCRLQAMHEGGRNEDASAARVHRGGVHQHNCAQDARMHAPEQLGSSWPRGRTNAFLGHGHFSVKREVLLAKEQFSVQNGHRKGSLKRYRSENGPGSIHRISPNGIEPLTPRFLWDMLGMYTSTVSCSAN